MPSDGWASSRARRELVKLVASGEIHEDLEPHEAYFICQHRFPDKFQYHGFESRFPERLEAVFAEVERDKGVADIQKQALMKDREMFPKKTTNHRGEPRWEGGKAEELLLKDMEDGKHLQMKPSELRATRQEYQEYPKQVFRKHIHQAKSARKFNQFCADMSKKKYAASDEKARIAKEKKEKAGSATVAELKELCRAKGLKVSGTKSKLLLRLRDHADTEEAEKAEKAQAENIPQDV